MATEIAPESTLESGSALAQFDAELEGQQMEGHWRGAVGLPTEPRSRIQPYIWKWDLVYRQLLRAGELVPLDGREGRRTLRLLNPGQGFTTHTIHMSVQLVKPGRSRRRTATPWPRCASWSRGVGRTPRWRASASRSTRAT